MTSKGNSCPYSSDNSIQNKLSLSLFPRYYWRGFIPFKSMSLINATLQFQIDHGLEEVDYLPAKEECRRHCMYVAVLTDRIVMAISDAQ